MFIDLAKDRGVSTLFLLFTELGIYCIHEMIIQNQDTVVRLLLRREVCLSDVSTHRLCVINSEICMGISNSLQAVGPNLKDL